MTLTDCFQAPFTMGYSISSGIIMGPISWVFECIFSIIFQKLGDLLIPFLHKQLFDLERIILVFVSNTVKTSFFYSIFQTFGTQGSGCTMFLQISVAAAGKVNGQFHLPPLQQGPGQALSLYHAGIWQGNTLLFLCPDFCWSQVDMGHHKR